MSQLPPRRPTYATKPVSNCPFAALMAGDLGGGADNGRTSPDDALPLPPPLPLPLPLALPCDGDCGVGACGGAGDAAALSRPTSIARSSEDSCGLTARTPTTSGPVNGPPSLSLSVPLLYSSLPVLDGRTVDMDGREYVRLPTTLTPLLSSSNFCNTPTDEKNERTSTPAEPASQQQPCE